MKSNGNRQQGVASYYDNNTRQFLRQAAAKKAGAIHRKLYAPGVSTDAEAAGYVNELVLGVINETGAGRVLDLGCGVGGTIRYLRGKHSAEYAGITISRVQVEMAEELDTRIEEADFLDSRWFEDSRPYDVIYAIESLQHNPDHGRLCENLHKIMHSESRLVVIDDFMTAGPGSSPGADKMVRRFRMNWHAHGYTSLDDFTEIFDKAGFVLREKIDLTEYMKETPILDRLLRVPADLFSALPRRTAWMENIAGGNALKNLQSTGLSGYFKLVFQPK